MDPISLIIGGALVAAGWLAGRVHRRRNRTPKLPSTATMCSCGHGHGTHVAGGICQAQIERPHYMKHGGAQRLGVGGLSLPDLRRT